MSVIEAMRGDLRAALPLTAALVYRTGDRCPACWGEHWWVGRQSAECVNCGLPLAISASSIARAA
jgi:hypothetical protein